MSVFELKSLLLEGKISFFFFLIESCSKFNLHSRSLVAVALVWRRVNLRAGAQVACQQIQWRMF